MRYLFRLSTCVRGHTLPVSTRTLREAKSESLVHSNFIQGEAPLFALSGGVCMLRHHPRNRPDRSLSADTCARGAPFRIAESVHPRAPPVLSGTSPLPMYFPTRAPCPAFRRDHPCPRSSPQPPVDCRIIGTCLRQCSAQETPVTGISATARPSASHCPPRVFRFIIQRKEYLCVSRARAAGARSKLPAPWDSRACTSTWGVSSLCTRAAPRARTPLTPQLTLEGFEISFLTTS